MILNVKPVYGNGWIDDGFQTIVAPSAFEITSNQECGSFKMHGVIISTQHPFHGGIFDATHRWQNNTSMYNCTVEILDAGLGELSIKKYTGYCEILNGTTGG